jgi:hypothetical protein
MAFGQCVVIWARAIPEVLAQAVSTRAVTEHARRTGRSKRQERRDRTDTPVRSAAKALLAASISVPSQHTCKTQFRYWMRYPSVLWSGIFLTGDNSVTEQVE